MTKSLTWTTTCNVLSTPTIIASDITTSTDLQQIITNNRLVYEWYNNLPSSFKWSKFKQDWWFTFQPAKLLSYTDTWSCSNLTDKSDYSLRVLLLKWLQDSYSGTILKNAWEIKNILNLVIDTNNPSNETLNYAGNFVNNTLWGNIIASSSSSSSSSSSWWPTWWMAWLKLWSTRYSNRFTNMGMM